MALTEMPIATPSKFEQKQNDPDGGYLSIIKKYGIPRQALH